MTPITEREVLSIVSDISGIPPDADLHADLYLDLGMASIHALQLLMELEERYAVLIPDEDFVESNSIAKLTAQLNRLLGMPPGSVQ